MLLKSWLFFFQAEDGIRDLVRSRGLGDVYKRQHMDSKPSSSMSEAWMQGKMDELSSAIKNADANEAQIRSTRIGRDVGVEAWVGAV